MLFAQVKLLLGAVAIVAVEAHHGNALHRSAPGEKFFCVRDGYPGAVHSQVHIHQKTRHGAGFLKYLSQGMNLSGVISHGPKPYLGICHD